MNTTGVPTVKGAEHWQTPTLRQMPCSARFAGLRECRGQIVGDAVWEPIHYRRETGTDPGPFRCPYSLGSTGARHVSVVGDVVVRQVWQHVVLVEPRGHQSQLSPQVCGLSGPDHGGCGRMTVVSEPVEDLISEAMLTRLDSTELAGVRRRPHRQSPRRWRTHRPGRHSLRTRPGWTTSPGSTPTVPSRPGSGWPPATPSSHASATSNAASLAPRKRAPWKGCSATWPYSAANGHTRHRPAPRHHPRCP